MNFFVFDEMFFVPEESKKAALKKYQKVCYNLWETEDAQPESFREADKSIISDLLREFDYMATIYKEWVTYSPAFPLVRMFEATEEAFERGNYRYEFHIKLTDNDCDGVYCFKLEIETYELKNGEWQYYCCENHVLDATDDNNKICAEQMLDQICGIIYPDENE